MKKVSLLLFVTLILLLAFVACNKHEHDFAAATCESPAKCSCGETQGEALGHDMTAATCTTPATCNVCGAVDGTAIGHSWRDATCTTPKTCLTCNETEGTLAAHKNDIVLEAKPATCSATGLTEGVKCSACGTITTEQIVIDKLAHTEATLPAVESTCDKEGLTAGKECSVCHEVLEAQQPTEKKDHTEKIVPGYAATCTVAGREDGKECSVCGETILEQKVIPATGHTEETVPGYAATCTTAGLTDGKKCSVCQATVEPQEEIPASHQNVVDKEAKEPTCTEDGYEAGTFCEACQTVVTGMDKIGASGHAYKRKLVEDSYVEPTCLTSGYYEWFTGCWWCDYSYVEVITSESETNPQGLELDALGHDMLPATCMAYAECTRCDFVDEAAGYADHTKGEATIENELKATCDNAGSYNKVYYCTACKTHVIENIKVTVDALGHDMADATCTAPSTCTRCDHFVGEKRANHKLEMSYENGKVVYSCGAASCEDVKFVIESEGVYFDGGDPELKTNGLGFVANDSKNQQYTTSGKNYPDVIVDENGNKYYQYYKKAASDSPVQLQLWTPKQANGFSDLSSAASSVGFLSFKVNTYADQELLIRLAEGVKTFVDNEGKEQTNWYGSPLGSIPGNVFRIAPVKQGGKIVSYNVQSWNKTIFNIPVNAEYDGDKLVIDSMYTGWMDVKIGLVMDEETDTIFTYYYINYGGNEYVVCDTAALTTENNKITCAYFNFYGAAEGTGYRFDDLAFGYTKNAEWIFDVCNHNYGTPVVTEPDCKNGGYTTAVCTICKFANVYDHTDKLGHAIVNVDAQASTCIAQGWDAYSYCSRCEDADAAKTAALRKLADHTLGEATEMNRVEPQCEVKGSYDNYYYCTVCGTYEFEDEREVGLPIKETGHTEVTVPGYAATCTTAGFEDGKKCSVCGATTLARKEIPASGHDYITVDDGVEATCKDAGREDGTGCSRCDYYVAGATIPKTDEHTEVTVPGYAATCTATGKTDGVECSVCGATLTAQADIPKVAHTYDDGADTDCNVCGAVRTCQHPNVITLDAVPATCYSTGLTEGSKCADCDEPIVAQEVIPTIDHTLVEYGAVTSAQPCKTPHTIAGVKCSVEGCTYVKSEPYAAALVAHTEKVLAAKAATCTETGLTEGSECSVCGDTIVAQTVIPATGHTKVVDQAKAPTCTATGLTAGEHCSVCGEVLDAQEVIPANGHNMAAATCDAPSTCAVCGYTDGEALANHTLAISYADGTLTYKCTTCAANSFNIDTTDSTKSVYLDGTANMTTQVSLQNEGQGFTSNTPVDGYYDFTQQDEGTGKQGQIWIKRYASGLTGFSAANNAVGFFSAKLNLNLSKTGNLGDQLNVKLVESHTKNGDTGYHWDSPQGCIKDNLFQFTPIVDEQGVTTGYKMATWSNSKVLSVKGDGNWSGWFNIAVGIELDEVADMVIAHYYIDGEYWYSASRELTTASNSLTSVYMNLNTQAKGRGYKLDDLAFGYVANSEWTFDECAHTYGDATTVAPECTNKGYDKSVCTICGYVKRDNYVNAKGHEAIADATCMDKSVCKVCGETISEALNHNIVPVYTDKLVYSCSRCDDYNVAIEDGYYNDGTGYSGLVTGIGNNKAHGYTDRADTLPEIVDGHYEFIKDDSYAGSGQVQIYIPGSGNHSYLKGFTTANNALGVFSFKVNLKLDTGNIRVILADIAAKLDAKAYNDSNSLTLLTFNVPKNGQMEIGGWKAGTLKTVTLQDGWTGELDVMTVIKLTSDNKIAINYYINGELLKTVNTDMLITTGLIDTLYITGNSTAAGTGYIFDDLAFGYTTNGHWTLDGQEHVVDEATACDVPEKCSCGWVGLGLDHDLIPATCTAPATCKDCGAQVGNKAAHDFSVLSYDKGTLKAAYFCANGCNTGCTLTGYYYDGTDSSYYYASNGNMPLDKSEGYYEYLFNPTGEEQTAENGWANNSNNNKWGAQPMFWIPTRNDNGGLDGLSAENNATGIISFSMRTNMTQEFTFAIGKERSYDKWDADGGWKLCFNIFKISAYSDAGVTIENIYGGGKVMATIPAAGDGWSEWFDMDIVISLKDNGAITLDYYVNDAHVHTAKGTLYTVPSTDKYLDIRAVYINGWTYVPGTGLAFDNFTFGALLDHNLLDGNDHVMTKGDCVTPSTCSCGWESSVKGSHEWTGTATCTQGQICSKCGAEGERIAHEVTASVVDSKPTYSCANCTRTFVPGVYVSGDGSSTDYIQSIGGTATLLTTATEDGNSYYSVIGTSDTAVNDWTWLNATGDAAINRLSGFSCANNSSGVISFKLNLQGISSTLGIRPAYGRLTTNDSHWIDINGDGNKWDDNTLYLMTIQPASSGTTRNITSDYGTVGTVNINEWIDFVISIQLHNDGTMSLDYYINGVLALSADKVAMMNSGKISSVELELKNATTGNGYLLDDFVVGYGNTVDSHWNLDGKDHSVVEGSKATCESGIKCSCGDQIGAALGHNIDTAATYDAATNSVVYSCERSGCTHTIEMTGFYNDGTNKNNFADTTAAKTYFTATANEGDGYYTLIQNTINTGTQFEIWIPSQSNPDFMQDFSCANNAFGILAFKVNAYTTSGFTFQAVSERGTGNWGWPNSNEIFGISGVSNGTVNLTGLSDKQNSNRSTLKSISVTDNWTGWLDVVITLQLTSNGKFTATYYVNGENIGTVTRTVQAYQRFTAMYVSGNSNVVGSGIMLDEFSFAYMVPEN